jgi:glucose-6-phosphate 1-dehydrogenase
MTGDQTLFNRADMVEETWRVVGKVLEDWTQRKPGGFPNYASGSDGPADADELLARSGRAWRSVVDPADGHPAG